MTVDQHLVDAAIDQLNRRWPSAGWGVAAAVRLGSGEIITSVGLDNLNSGATLCAEAGALCQAYTLGERVTASACVARDANRPSVSVLAPCGICQERLALWGPTIHVAVPDRNAIAGWKALALAELHPHYWGTYFGEDDKWPDTETHCS